MKNPPACIDRDELLQYDLLRPGQLQSAYSERQTVQQQSERFLCWPVHSLLPLPRLRTILASSIIGTYTKQKKCLCNRLDNIT